MADELTPDNADDTATNDTAQRDVTIQKLYVKDASIEVPNAPQIFTEEFQPEVNVDLNTQVQPLAETAFEVAVTVTINATQGETTAYIVEVQYAGVFEIDGEINEEAQGQLLGAYCPTIIFPYLRETAGDMVQRAGFPHFVLQPVNFEALYAQHQAEQTGDAQNASRTTH
ncbi:protein-export chaperone SecB [Salinisphaera orenii]|uniref:protein-export chaperone SecB n=1 Tax=Salinisphaera orenii TaxID=856731 RepID=UPI000DBE63E2